MTRVAVNKAGIDALASSQEIRQHVLEAASMGAKLTREKTPRTSGSARKKVVYGVRKVGSKWVGWFGSNDIAAHLIEFGGGRSTAHRPITKAAQDLGGSNFHVGGR